MTYIWNSLTSSAPYPVRDGTARVVHNGAMVILGGVNTTTLNDAWQSFDGINWTALNTNCPWEKRHSSVALSFNGRIYLLGGDAVSGHYQPDVWSSADGVTWQQETANAPWGNRVLHFGAVLGGKMWVWGGQTLTWNAPPPTTFFTDAWSSTDGISWTKEGDLLPFGTRSAVCGSAILNGELYVFGGGTYDTTDYPTRDMKYDVWKTTDGVDWQLVCPRVPWVPRLYNSIEVFDNQLWMMGGHNINLGNGTNGDLADVWRSPDGVKWFQEPTPPWTKRHAGALFSFNNALYWLTGDNYAKDVWKLYKDVFTYGARQNGVTGWGAQYTIIDRSCAIPGNTLILTIGVQLNAPHAGTIYRVLRENAPNNYDSLWATAAFTNAGGGYDDKTCGYTTPNDGGTYRIGLTGSLPSTPAEVFANGGYSRAMVAGTISTPANNLTLAPQYDGTICVRWS